MALFDLVIAADLTVGETVRALALAAVFMALPLLIAAGLAK
jgi:hypothetical protein